MDLMSDLETIVSKDFKPESLSADNFLTEMYINEIRGFNRIPYYVLQLSELNIDLKYVNGASRQCREFRCCHAAEDRTIPQDISHENVAGPFGAYNCDMPLGGAK